jgi:hypothetical protein
VSAFSVATLAGCSADANFTPGVMESDTTVAALGGMVRGGPNPVSGAVVTLYATNSVASPGAGNNYGYGQPGTQLAQATTSSTGSFTFSSPGTCTAGQQAYIVSSGGNTGANSANADALLMAAIGPCSSLTSSSFIIINEPSTIAAAYALGQFMTIGGTTTGTSSPRVNISAPTNNNAAIGSCTLTSGQTTSCVAAGLAHAFLNAANLVNAVGTTTTPPSGQPYTVLKTNSSGVVPQSLINTLANSVEACINSSGAGSSACTTLMSDTQPLASLISPQPAAPTNTLQALIDLAEYPQPAILPGTTNANTNPAGIYGIGSSIGYYVPSLASAPTDFTLAINYPGTNGTAFTAPWNVTTDINDNIYVADALGTSLGTRVESITSNGTPRWVFTSTDGVTDGPGSAAARMGMATDTTGHLYVTTAPELYQLNAATGASILAAATPSGDSAHDVAVDQNNNAFATMYAGSTGSLIQELASGTSSWTNLQVAGANFTANTLGYITIDNAGDIYASFGGTCPAAPTNCQVLYFNNSGTVTAPVYSAPIPLPQGADQYEATPLIDEAGNAWLVDSHALWEWTGTVTAGVGATTNPVLTPWDGGAVRQAAMDGDNKIAFSVASGGSGYVALWYPTGSNLANAWLNLTPCCQTATATAPGTIIDNAGRGITVDDTGSIWETFTSGPTNVLQILGPGAPTWGQPSWGHVGLLLGSQRPF